MSGVRRLSREDDRGIFSVGLFARAVGNQVCYVVVVCSRETAGQSE